MNATDNSGADSEEAEHQTPITKEAFRFLEIINRSGRKKDFIDSIDDKDVKRNVKNYLKKIESDEEPKRDMSSKIRAAIGRFYYNNFEDDHTYEVLLNRLAKSTSVSQERITHFTGSYVVFRSSARSKFGYTPSAITIKRERNLFSWSHKKTVGSAVDDHYGFVFDYGDRLYLTGMGPNFTRPMLVEKPDGIPEAEAAKSEFLHGALSSITENGEIYAANFFMVHEDHSEYEIFSRRLWNADPDSPLHDRIRQILRTRANFENGVMILSKAGKSG